MTQQELEAKIRRLEDYRDICNLQGRYNHYMLSGRFDKILDMFAKKDSNVIIELADSGEYRGIEGVKKVFNILHEKYGFPGSLGLHMLMTPVVEVSKDGKTARGMWHSFGCNTIKDGNRVSAMWQAGKYDITFVKEDGKWMIKNRMNFNKAKNSKDFMELIYMERGVANNYVRRLEQIVNQLVTMQQSLSEELDSR